MNQNNTQVINFVKLALAAFAFLFSLVAFILLVATDFGGWWEGGTDDYYFWIGGQYIGWTIIFLILLMLMFLALMAISVVLAIDGITGKLGKLAKMLGFVGIFLAGGAFLFTGITVGMFAIYVGGVAESWWLDAGFYGSLVGSLLVAIFLILNRVLEATNKPKEPQKTP
jgi:hypothetical protein